MTTRMISNPRSQSGSSGTPKDLGRQWRHVIPKCFLLMFDQNAPEMYKIPKLPMNGISQIRTSSTIEFQISSIPFMEDWGIE